MNDTITTSLRFRLLAAGVGLALVGTACGSDTVENTNEPAADVVVDEAPTPEPDLGVDGGTAEQLEASPEPAPEAEPEPEAGPAPEPEPESAPAPCGDLGPLPDRPDSMPTVLADTDEDGELDDEVTAYGATDAWRLRVVEDGTTTEAAMPAITGWAHLVGIGDMGDGLTIGVRDAETDEIYEFGFDDDRCLVQVAGPGVDPIDEFVIATPPVDPPPVDGPGDLATMGACGVFPPIPDDAIIGSDVLVQLDGDGEEERLVTYRGDDGWKLRQVWHGTVSEVDLPVSGFHLATVIGLADVADHGGDEILVSIDNGGPATSIGVFSSFEGPCLFRFQSDGGGDFSLPVGGEPEWGHGLLCGDGWMLGWNYDLEDDGTYFVSEAAFEEVSTGVFGYMPASDGFSENVPADELNSELFDCFGLEL